MDRLLALRKEYQSSASSPIYYLVKRLASASSPAPERATFNEYHTAEVAHAALIEYMRKNYPFHRWYYSSTSVVGCHDWYRGCEGYIKEKVLKDGDRIEEEIVGWVWVEKVEGWG